MTPAGSYARIVWRSRARVQSSYADGNSSALNVKFGTQMADIGVQPARSPICRLVAPHALGESLGRHDVAAGDDQRRDGGPLPAPAEFHHDPDADRVDLAQHPQRQPAGFIHRRSCPPSDGRSRRFTEPGRRSPTRGRTADF